MWRSVQSPSGLLRVINDTLLLRQLRGIELPDYSKSSTVILASDYSGEQQSSRYIVLSFVLTSLEAFAGWERDRQLVRHQHGLGPRRMAFSKLNDGIKRRALGGFLDAIGRFDAVLVSVAVNKEVLSLFDESGSVNLREWRLDAWSGWDHAAFEKMLRVTHIGAFLLAGLSTAGQNAFWITDEDAIAPNTERLDQLVDQLAHLLDRCLPHSLGHLRVATTAADTGIKDLEDLAASQTYSAELYQNC